MQQWRPLFVVCVRTVLHSSFAWGYGLYFHFNVCVCVGVYVLQFGRCCSILWQICLDFSLVFVVVFFVCLVKLYCMQNFAFIPNYANIKFYFTANAAKVF